MPDDDKRQELLLKLQQTYGHKLLFVIHNGEKALQDIERRMGTEKSEQLKPHIQSCKEWGKQLGIWDEEEPAKQESSTGSGSEANNVAPPKKKRPMPSLMDLQQIEQHLEKRAESVRGYVAKHADPDLFLFEAMERKDKELVANRNASKLLASTLLRRIQYVQKQQQQSQLSGNESLALSEKQQQSTEDEQTTALKDLQQALDKAQASVPPPTRNDSKQLEASLRHLDKIRAASTALMHYFTIKGDRIATVPPQTLKKIQGVMSESIEFVVSVLKDDNKGAYNGKDGEDAVTLQDAWMKRMELQKPILAVENTASDTAAPPAKRVRTNNFKPYIKARLLFHPNRKMPSSLLIAVQRKGAKLIRPGNNNSPSVMITTYLELEFGKAFTMTIYLSPLTVAMRAMPPRSKGTNDNATMNNMDSPQGTVSWKPLSYGLTGESTDKSKDPLLSVWGVSSTYDTIGHVVEERLRDASTHATYLLRKCFQNHVKDKTVDFEVEILEGSALLEFLKVARETYIPQWQDYDL
jgi:hypothetical protein